jgi:hypothetical protein
MYQNQLMNLKEKGKRLLRLDELDYVERQQELDAQLLAEKMLKKQKKNSTRRLKTERLLYERMQVMQKLFQQFEEKSRGYQEKN